MHIYLCVYNFFSRRVMLQIQIVMLIMAPTMKIIYETDVCLHFLYMVKEKLCKSFHTYLEEKNDSMLEGINF